MHEKYLRKIRFQVQEIKEKIIHNDTAIASLENIYTILETDVSYNKFLQICKYIFAKNDISFDLIVTNKNKTFFVFKKSKSNKMKIYIGEDICTLCNENAIGSEHHIRHREFGGKDIKNNLVFLCLECHNKIEIFCFCCENSRNICDIQMFNSC